MHRLGANLGRARRFEREKHDEAHYLSELRRTLNDQNLLSFSIDAGKKAGLRQIGDSTEVAGVDLATHHAV
jgi:hypothetical protein